MSGPAAASALVVGGDSTIGRAVTEAARSRGWLVCATTRRAEMAAGGSEMLRLDLMNEAAVRSLAMPRLAEGASGRVFLLAGETSLRACREREAAAWSVNVSALGELARRVAESGWMPVMVSTNLVFSGRSARVPADAATEPATAYGRQKAALESVVRGVGGLVVRPTKVLPAGPALLSGWSAALRRGERVEAYTDLWFSPVPVGAVVSALLEEPAGVTQVSGRHDVSYFEAALHVAERVGADPGLVVPGQASLAGVPEAERPRHTTLACDRPFDPWAVLDAALGFTPVRDLRR